jgi:hypothetical protein
VDGRGFEMSWGAGAGVEQGGEKTRMRSESGRFGMSICSTGLVSI